MSRLKLTKIITVTPFFLVVNQSSRPLRYMEENKHTDLWFDLTTGQVYSKPVLSGHLKIDKTKVLMENGSLMEVESIAECSP